MILVGAKTALRTLLAKLLATAPKKTTRRSGRSKTRKRHGKTPNTGARMMTDQTEREFVEMVRAMERNAPTSSSNVDVAVGSFGDRQHLVKTLCLTCYEAGQLEGSRQALENLRKE